MKTKRWTIKQLSLLVAILLLATMTVGGSLAYIFTQTDSVTNVFRPAEVTCAINETMDGKVKSNVSVTNTGDTDAYIRVAIIATWQNEDGVVLADFPVKGTDYSIAFADDGWDLDSEDGYYYYKASVPVSGETGVLISECKQLNDAPIDGYTLCVEIIADAIQANPADAVTEAWGVNPSTLE